MENLNKYDDLLRCRTTIEEEEQQPQEVLKKRREVVRLKEKVFAETMTDLPAERLKLLEDSPFYKLVEMMSGHVQNNKVIKKLASLFSTNNKSLSLLLDGTCCIVTPQDFTSITGVEDGDEDVIICPFFFFDLLEPDERKLSRPILRGPKRNLRKQKYF